MNCQAGKPTYYTCCAEATCAGADQKTQHTEQVELVNLLRVISFRGCCRAQTLRSAENSYVLRVMRVKDSPGFANRRRYKLEWDLHPSTRPTTVRCEL